MPLRLLSLIALLCLPAALHAQSEAPARYQFFGGYSYISNSLNGVTGSHQPLSGWDASVAFPSWRNLRFKVDVAGYTGTNLGAPQNPYFILAGGQYSKRLGRETLFAEGLIGDGGANKAWGGSVAAGETASFASLLGGGLDTRLSRHFAFRVNGGYQYSYFAIAGSGNVPYRIPGLPTNFGRLSSGLVWLF